MLIISGVTVLWKHKESKDKFEKVETQQTILKEEKDFHFIRPYS